MNITLTTEERVILTTFYNPGTYGLSGFNEFDFKKIRKLWDKVLGAIDTNLANRVNDLLPNKPYNNIHDTPFSECSCYGFLGYSLGVVNGEEKEGIMIPYRPTIFDPKSEDDVPSMENLNEYGFTQSIQNDASAVFFLTWM